MIYRKKRGKSYIINIDEYESMESQWIAFYINAKNVTYFDSFEVEYIPKEIKELIENKKIITNIYGIQAYDSIMWRCFCIGFIDFMLKGKSLKIFSIIKKTKKLYCVICSNYRKFGIPKISYLLEQTLALSIICSKCNNEYEKYLKKKNQLKY